MPALLTDRDKFHECQNCSSFSPKGYVQDVRGRSRRIPCWRCGYPSLLSGVRGKELSKWRVREHADRQEVAPRERGADAPT
jgi:hypothetical protein